MHSVTLHSWFVGVKIGFLQIKFKLVEETSNYQMFSGFAGKRFCDDVEKYLLTF